MGIVQQSKAGDPREEGREEETTGDECDLQRVLPPPKPRYAG